MKNIPKDTSDFSSITAILQNYFDGLHHGDVDKLAAQFHPDAWLKAPGARRSLNQWLTDVSSRPVPAALNKPFAFEILSIDVVQDQAMAKLNVHYLNLIMSTFWDFLKNRASGES